jgi:hypothetical protein
MKIIYNLFIVVPLLFGMGCESEANKAAKEKARQEAEKQHKIEFEAEIERRRKENEEIALQRRQDDLQKQQEIEVAKTTFKKLKAFFTYEKDEFNNSIRYRHRSYSKYNNGSGTTIRAWIWNNELSCTSVYVADDWIFHESFLVKIGDKTIEASGRTKHEVVSGVIENVYPNQATEDEILLFIAANPKADVRVRLSGKYYKDYTLRKVHHEAICQTVELWNALKILSSNGIDPQGV